MNAGTLLPKDIPDSNYLGSLNCDSQYEEDTVTSVTTNDSESQIKQIDKE